MYVNREKDYVKLWIYLFNTAYIYCMRTEAYGFTVMIAIGYEG